MRHAREEELAALLDLVVAHPEGVTRSQIGDAIGNHHTYRTWVVVHGFRLLFGDDDTINLVCVPNGRGQPWLYKLTGTFDGDEGVENWALNRLGDAESRLETMAAMLASVRRNVDGRTVPGRKARIMARAIDRAREDIAELSDGEGPAGATV